MYSLQIVNDPYPENPRDWDNLGVMICFHRRYNLGDENEIPYEDLNSWEELGEYLRKKLKACIVLPLYLYDHSGITISTNPFSCKWDSGQVGFIYTTKEQIRDFYSRRYITQSWITIARQVLLDEVATYDQYLTGEVYGWEITNLETEEKVESCYGYYNKSSAEQDGEQMLCALQSQSS